MREGNWKPAPTLKRMAVLENTLTCKSGDVNLVNPGQLAARDSSSLQLGRLMLLLLLLPPPPLLLLLLLPPPPPPPLLLLLLLLLLVLGAAELCDGGGVR